MKILIIVILAMIILLFIYWFSPASAEPSRRSDDFVEPRDFEGVEKYGEKCSGGWGLPKCINGDMYKCCNKSILKYDPKNCDYIKTGEKCDCKDIQIGCDTYNVCGNQQPVLKVKGKVNTVCKNGEYVDICGNITKKTGKSCMNENNKCEEKCLFDLSVGPMKNEGGLPILGYKHISCDNWKTSINNKILCNLKMTKATTDTGSKIRTVDDDGKVWYTPY